MEPAPFRWEHFEAIYWLGLIPFYWLLYISYHLWRKRAERRLADPGMWAYLAPQRRQGRKTWRLFLLSGAHLMVVLAMMNPQYGSRSQSVERKGVDLYIALDLSRSMNADDVAPNRLARAKLFVRELIDQLRGDRIGLIVFGGNAYIQMPLTIDYAAARMYLETLTTEMIPTQGTAIGASIRLALSSFERGTEDYRSILVVSDGENHQGDAIEAARAAAEAGASLLSVGVGSARGGPVPDPRDDNQNYIRDRQGQIVVSRLNENMLEEIAAAGQGSYYRLEQAPQTARLVADKLNDLEKRTLETQIFAQYESYFQYPLALGLLFFIVALTLQEKKSQKIWSSETLSHVS